MSIHPHLSHGFRAAPRAVAKAYQEQRANPMRATLEITADWIELILAAGMAVGVVLALLGAGDGFGDLWSLFD